MQTSKLEELIGEYADLEQRLADPDVHADQANARKLGRRHAELAPVVQLAGELKQARADQEAARDLADQDAGFAEEAEQLGERIQDLESQIDELLLPRDEHDSSDVLLEVKSGAGGEESALFARDLLRMYVRFAERHGWRTDVLDTTESDLGGCKDATIAVKTKGNPGADGVWSKLKYEGGVHRVQRVPVTESQGRVHTSAAGVLVYPEPEEGVEVEVDEKDLRIDVFRSSGPGGQSVNTTDSAVRLTHQPTGIVVSCQNQKSQLQNKMRAIQVLRARLQAMADEEAQREAVETRRSQVRTVDRSERIRTYNFPENRISDHRVNYKAYNLEQVLDGDLDAVVAALSAADRDERLAATS